MRREALLSSIKLKKNRVTISLGSLSAIVESFVEISRKTFRFLLAYTGITSPIYRLTMLRNYQSCLFTAALVKTVRTNGYYLT